MQVLSGIHICRFAVKKEDSGEQNLKNVYYTNLKSQPHGLTCGWDLVCEKCVQILGLV